MALLCLTCGTGQASDKTADIVPTVRCCKVFNHALEPGKSIVPRLLMSQVTLLGTAVKEK
jgi:hypothetical protein